MTARSRRQAGARIPAVLVVAILMTSGEILGQSPAGTAATPTFTKDIAPILQSKCQECHRPGTIAPMSLITYEDVRPWARAMKVRTASREMPPWLIEKEIGIQHFMNDSSLSDAQIATIAKWADGGAPRGNAADMPPPRQFLGPDEWTVGKPDLIVSSPEFVVKELSPDTYPQLDLTPLGLREDRYIAAVEFKEVRLDGVAGRTEGRPKGDLSLFVVHHAGVGTTDPAQRPDPANPDPAARGLRDDGSFQLTYEVGQNATFFPDDAAPVLDAGSSLSWSLHVHSSGKEVRTRLDVAFKLHPPGYKPRFVQRSVQFGRVDLLIKPLEADQRFEAFWMLPQPGKLITYEPHMHMHGK